MNIIIYIICAVLGYITGWKLMDWISANNKVLKRISLLKEEAENANEYHSIAKVQRNITNFISTNDSLTRRQARKFNEVLDIIATKTKTL